MYIALTSGSTTGKSGARYQWNAGDVVEGAKKGELDHVKSLIWDKGAGKEASSLPEALPGRDAFEAAGITSIEEIRALENPTKVKGVGKATAKELAEWLAANT